MAQTRFWIVSAAGIGYAIASLWLMTRSPPSAWTPVVLLVPVLAIAATSAWRSGRRARSAIALAAALTLALLAAHGGALDPEQMLLAEHVAVHLVLAFSFGITLRPGVRPLISRAAERLHGSLTPAEERYTRNVTLAWTIYFMAMAIVSIALHALLPFRLWALYANLGAPLAAAAMFAGELWLRYRLHPEFERSSPRDMIQAFREARAAAPLPPASGPGPMKTPARPLGRFVSLDESGRRPTMDS